jgi:hypothetical protein
MQFQQELQTGDECSGRLITAKKRKSIPLTIEMAGANAGQEPGWHFSRPPTSALLPAGAGVGAPLYFLASGRA